MYNPGNTRSFRQFYVLTVLQIDMQFIYQRVTQAVVNTGEMSRVLIF